MTDDATDFASLLCSRLCHDLLSPIGALNNGLELLVDEHDPDMRARVLTLLSDSAQASAAKLKFFRLAFGASGGFGEQVDAREVKGAIEGVFAADRKIQLGWLVAQPALDKIAMKVLLNLAIIAGDALVRGGRLDVGVEGSEIVVRAEGPRILLDPELRRALAGELERSAVSPRSAAAWLAHSLVKAGGGAIMVSGPSDGVMLFGAALAG